MLTVQAENDLPLSAALMQAANEADDATLAEFYEWLGQTYSSGEYAKVKANCAGEVSPKFLAVCHRTRRLMPIAKSLAWDRKRDLKTLDLGSGAGHMGLIANFFGHRAIGIDDSELFDRLRAFWIQPAIKHRIEARVPLPPLGRFHSISSILTNFGRRWTVAEWGEFLDRLLAEHLEAGGEFVLHFPGNQALEYRNRLRQRASKTEDGGRLMFFTRPD